MKKLPMIAGTVVAVPFVLFVAFLGYSAMTAYHPAPEERLPDISTDGAGERMAPHELSFLTWNIGYAGLDSLTDFVVDGGRMSLARSREAVLENLGGITKAISGAKADFYLIQEVDVDSSRSFHVGQVEPIVSLFPGFHAWLAVNYRARFVPFPATAPMGGVHSGILTVSRYRAESSVRYQLPGEFPFPLQYFQLRRCASFTTFESPFPGRKLVVVNLHLSAFDEGGFLRQQELNHLKEKVQKLHGEGHFVVMGGDWNSLFPGVNDDQFTPYTTRKKHLFWVQRIPADWTPRGWTWAYDPSAPTVRTDEKPYVKGENYTTIVDGFLLSPNVELRSVKALDLGFAHSDHNPVSITVRLQDSRE